MSSRIGINEENRLHFLSSRTESPLAAFMPATNLTHNTAKTAGTRVGVVGTGFIAVGLCVALRHLPDMSVSRLMTRRTINSVGNVDARLLTRSLDQLIEESDVIVECSGDVLHAATVVDAAMKAGIPVVTMGSEFQVTVGSYFAGKGWLSEAEGDQPGCLAALNEEARDMGFVPLVYGNIKGFLNHHPERETMSYWSQRQGISQMQVTSFTDGTKLQIEQTLVANGLGCGIAQRGLIGTRDMPLAEGGAILAQHAKLLGHPISDYLLNAQLPPGVFITAEHPTERPEVLRYLKLGDGPYYTLLRPYHLCHLEIPRTIRRLKAGRGPLLNNSVKPKVMVAAVAKRDVPAGAVIETAIGGEEFRGEAMLIGEAQDLPPLGLLIGARIKHSLAQGQTVKLSDVEIPDSLAKTAWESVRDGSSASVVADA